MVFLSDTSNFDVDESDFTPKEVVPLQSNSIFSGNHLPFLGFTYTKGSKLSDLESLLEAGMFGRPVGGSVTRFFEQRNLSGNCIEMIESLSHSKYET